MEKQLTKVSATIVELILESEDNTVDIESIVGPDPVMKTEDGASTQFVMFADRGRLTYTVTITAKYESEED